MTTISKKARYVIHGLTYIAAVSDGRPVPFDAIFGYLRGFSGSLTLSESYIAKVFQEVSRAGFLSAATGPGGGYKLTRQPGNIIIVELVEAIDGPIVADCCLLPAGDCPREEGCVVRGLVHEAEAAFYRVLARESLASLAERMVLPDDATIAGHRPGAQSALQAGIKR
jgi:Rrf2 family protein